MCIGKGLHYNLLRANTCTCNKMQSAQLVVGTVRITKIPKNGTLSELFTYSHITHVSRLMTKTKKMTVRPAKTQISLGIHLV